MPVVRSLWLSHDWTRMNMLIFFRYLYGNDVSSKDVTVMTSWRHRLRLVSCLRNLVVGHHSALLLLQNVSRLFRRRLRSLSSPTLLHGCICKAIHRTLGIRCFHQLSIWLQRTEFQLSIRLQNGRRDELSKLDRVCSLGMGHSFHCRSGSCHVGVPQSSGTMWSHVWCFCTDTDCMEIRLWNVFTWIIGIVVHHIFLWTNYIYHSQKLQQLHHFLSNLM